MLFIGHHHQLDSSQWWSLDTNWTTISVESNSPTDSVAAGDEANHASSPAVSPANLIFLRLIPGWNRSTFSGYMMVNPSNPQKNTLKIIKVGESMDLPNKFAKKWISQDLPHVSSGDAFLPELLTSSRTLRLTQQGASRLRPRVVGPGEPFGEVPADGVEHLGSVQPSNQNQHWHYQVL